MVLYRTDLGMHSWSATYTAWKHAGNHSSASTVGLQAWHLACRQQGERLRQQHALMLVPLMVPTWLHCYHCKTQCTACSDSSLWCHLFEIMLGRLHKGGMEGPTDREGGHLHGPMPNGLPLHLCQHILVARNYPPLHPMPCFTHLNAKVTQIYTQSCKNKRKLERKCIYRYEITCGCTAYLTTFLSNMSLSNGVMAFLALKQA